MDHLAPPPAHGRLERRRQRRRIERIYRDMSIGNSHRNTLLRDWAFREIAREKLGLPRDFERANVQQPRN